MNLTTCIIIVCIVLEFEIDLINCAYKKKKNEHCSLQVNSLCYDDELDDKPLKIVHDDNNIKSIKGDEQSTGQKKNQKKSNDFRSKMTRQINLDLPKLLTKLNNVYKKNQESKSNDFNRSQSLLKSNKLDNMTTQSANSPKFIQTDPPSTTKIFHPYNNQFSTISSEYQKPLFPNNYLNRFNQFKTYNKPMIMSSSLHNSAFLTNTLKPSLLSNNFNNPFVNTFANDLLLFRLLNYNRKSILPLTKSFNYPIHTNYNQKTTKIASNYLPENVISEGMFENHLYKITTTSSPDTINKWPQNYLTTETNDLNVGLISTESLINKQNNSHFFNTSRDEKWSEDEQINSVFPIDSKSPFNFVFHSRKNNSQKSLFDDEFQFQSGIENKNKLPAYFSKPDSKIFFSDSEGSKEKFDWIKSANRSDNFLNNTEVAKDNQDNYFKFEGKELNKHDNDLNRNDELGEVVSNEKLETTQPLNQHESPTPIIHQIDNLLTNNEQKTPLEVDKSIINYLIDDELKHDFLSDQNFPIFYPSKIKTKTKKPTYTIIQLKDKKNDKSKSKIWKQYLKLLTRIVVEEAKRFKRNELDTFFKRKKLIIDRYRPNDMYQKAIAAQYVWKKVSLDFLTLLGYHIANYLGPLNLKHRAKYLNLLHEKPGEDELVPLNYILKNQDSYYQNGTNSYLDKYLTDTNYIKNDLADYTSFDSHLTEDKFLNDDFSFGKNYFQIDENDDSLLNQTSGKYEEPLIENSLADEPKLDNDAFQSAYIKKDKNLDKEFFQNQILNTKLLTSQFLNNKLTDLETKK